MRTARQLVLLLLVLLLGSAVALGCSRKSAPTAEATTEAPVVNDKTEGLLLTWIDEKGEFHAEQRVADVPANGRDMVRVRVLDPGTGTTDVAGGDRVFVADLRTAKTDGTYPVIPMLRTDFEDVAVKRREKSGSAVLSPKAAASAAIGALNAGGVNAGTNGTGPGPLGNPGDVAHPTVIIYGASWCGPCHQAAAHLKKRGVAFVERDIEQDSSAAREMQSKLAKAGMRGGSIPVIDVRGRILLGFDPRAVDQALGGAAQ